METMKEREHITRLLEMLEHPEAYSEQQIHDIINSDEETSATYRLMVAAKQGYRHMQTAQNEDADAAWQRFENEKLKTKSNKTATEQPLSSFFSLHTSIQKLAASFIGILLISGIAFAAIHMVRQHQKPIVQNTEQTANITKPVNIVPIDTLNNDTAIVQPIVYDNMPLEEILQEIAKYYGAEVTFQNEEARQLRFHFVWNQQQGMEKVISDLNHFKRLHVTMMENQLIVE